MLGSEREWRDSRMKYCPLQYSLDDSKKLLYQTVYSELVRPGYSGIVDKSQENGKNVGARKDARRKTTIGTAITPMTVSVCRR